MKELAQQRIIIKSLEAQGGFGHKYPSGGTVGWPDLILMHPDFGAVFMEVKIIKGVKFPFNRKIDTSALQKFTLRKINDFGGIALLAVVVYNGPRDQWLTILDHNYEAMNHQYLDNEYITSKRQYGGWYDVRRLVLNNISMRQGHDNG